jgi:hypothetical protein
LVGLGRLETREGRLYVVFHFVWVPVRAVFGVSAFDCGLVWTESDTAVRELS